MGCQHAIAKAIRDCGADYLLAVKSNQKSLHDEIALFFDAAHDLDTYEQTDGDHGRIETRTTRVCHAVNWLTNQRKAPGEPNFTDLAAIVEVKACVERNGETQRSRRFYISSSHLSARQAANAVRAHWGIENRLHWVMDVVFHDDLMRLRTENGPANMATIRHTAMNIVKSMPGKGSMKGKRKLLAWNETALINAIKNQHQ